MADMFCGAIGCDLENGSADRDEAARKGELG